MKNKFLSKIKYIVGLDDIEESIDVKKIGDNVREFPLKRDDISINTIDIKPSISNSIAIHEIYNFEEISKAADDLKRKKILFVNLENIYAEEKKKAFYFLNGVVYSLEGNITKYSKDILIITPKNVEMDSAIRSEFISRGLIKW